MRLVYNAVAFPFEETPRLIQTPVVENGRYVHTATDLTVNAVLTPDTVCRPGESFRSALARVRHDLERPRKPLYVFFDDGLPYLSSDGTDAADGPIPKVWELHTFAGLDTAHLTFTVRVCTRDCPNLNDAGPGWSYHAWNESLDVDDEHVTTRTRSGLLRLRGDRLLPDEYQEDGVPLNLTADYAAGLVSPPVPPWFLRVSSKYRVQEDGLALSYTFVDKEQYAMPPDPAVKASGRYEVTTSNGAKMYAQVSLTLVGRMDAGDHRLPRRLGFAPPSTGKQRLLNTAIAVAMNRLRRGAGPPEGKGRWLVTGGVSEDMYKPSVTVSLRCLAPTPRRTAEVVPGELRGGGVIGLAAGIGAVMALDPKQQAGRAAGKEGPVGELPRGLARFGWDQPPHLYDSPPPPGHERGSAWNLVQMAARALQDPCLEQRVAVLRGGGNRPPDYPAFPPSDPRPPFIIRPPRPNPGGGGNLGGGRVPGELVGGRMGAFSAAAAQISFAPAGTLVNEPADQESALGGRVWTHCELRPRFEKDKGRVARTEQKAGGKTVVVQTRAERVRYVVEWTAERVGAPPEVPPEDHEDANFSLLKSDWSPGVVTVADDGVTLIYTAAGRYEYAVLDPSKLKPGAVMEPAVAEVFGKGTAPILAGGPVLIDPTRKSDLTSGRAAGTVEEEWEKELKRWAGT